MPPQEALEPSRPRGDAATSSSLCAKKTVYLIRHAQSMENQRIASMFSCLGDIGRFSLPKKEDVGASFGLLNVSANADAPISELGHQQCAAMKKILNDNNFLPSEKVELIAHSPLERAKETCAELLGCSSNSVAEDERTEVLSFAEFTPTDSDQESRAKQEKNSTIADKTETKKLPDPVKRVVNLPLLTEKTHLEWVPGNSGRFETRVHEFQNWLAQQPESVICLVGHSQFFKLLLGLPFKFENCDVYKVTFDSLKTQPNEPVILEHDGTADECVLKPQWYELELLFSCKQSRKTPASEEDGKEKTNDATDKDGSESSL